MPAIPTQQAAERLAQEVAKAKPSDLNEIRIELFPGEAMVTPQSADALAEYVRTSLEPEEIVDLWNVVFPRDHNVWFNEEEQAVYYNDEAVGYVD